MQLLGKVEDDAGARYTSDLSRLLYFLFLLLLLLVFFSLVGVSGQRFGREVRGGGFWGSGLDARDLA